MLIAAILVIAIYTHPMQTIYTRIHQPMKKKSNTKKKLDAVTDASLVALLMTIELVRRFVCPQCRKLCFSRKRGNRKKKKKKRLPKMKKIGKLLTITKLKTRDAY